MSKPLALSVVVIAGLLGWSIGWNVGDRAATLRFINAQNTVNSITHERKGDRQ